MNDFKGTFQPYINVLHVWTCTGHVPDICPLCVHMEETAIYQRKRRIYSPVWTCGHAYKKVTTLFIVKDIPRLVENHTNTRRGIFTCTETTRGERRYRRSTTSTATLPQE